MTAALKSIRIDPPPFLPILETCAICLEESEQKEMLQAVHKTNESFHWFHTHCITPWIVGQARLDCPICRDPILTMIGEEISVHNLNETLKLLSFYENVRNGNLVEIQSYLDSEDLSLEIRGNALFFAAEAGKREALLKILNNGPVYLWDHLRAERFALQNEQFQIVNLLRANRQHPVGLLENGQLAFFPQDRVHRETGSALKIYGYVCAVGIFLTLALGFSFWMAQDLSPSDYPPIRSLQL